VGCLPEGDRARGIIGRVLDLPPTTLPAQPVAEIASYGATTAWVDPQAGVVVRRGGTSSSLKLDPKGLRDLDGGQAVGEGSAAGFGGLTAAADGTFTWQRAFRNGCASPQRVARRGTLRRWGVTVDQARAPLAVRYADPDIPGTPESEACEDG